MSAELFTTTASAWSVLLVAGIGIAALPWSAAEVRQSAAAFVALPRLLLSLSVRRPVVEPAAEPATVPAGC